MCSTAAPAVPGVPPASPVHHYSALDKPQATRLIIPRIQVAEIACVRFLSSLLKPQALSGRGSLLLRARG